MSDKKNRAVRGRFAPSPSGEMHLGNAWTALLAWLDIRSAGGAMVLRMEDLDPDRSKNRYVEDILKDLCWLGLDWDEGPDIGGPYAPYEQSRRTDLYQTVFEKLDANKLVFPCFCSRADLRFAASAPHAGEADARYPGTCRCLSGEEKSERLLLGRKPAYRLMVNRQKIGFYDGRCGWFEQDIQINSGDFVIRRGDGVYAYQLAVVIDDSLMNITRVVRGEDLLDSTPRQLYIYHLIGADPPEFFHVPLLCGQDGSRLSKRHGSLSLAALRTRGVSSSAIVRWLAYQAKLTDTPDPIHPVNLITRFSFSRLPDRAIMVKDDAGGLFA